MTVISQAIECRSFASQ